MISRPPTGARSGPGSSKKSSATSSPPRSSRPNGPSTTGCAARPRLTPFVKLARTIRAYRPSIEATVEWRLTNGIAESNNASIARIRANARGFHGPEAFITMILLDRASLAPKLPWDRAS